jgi:hypothetical protein
MQHAKIMQLGFGVNYGLFSDNFIVLGFGGII